MKVSNAQIVEHKKLADDVSRDSYSYITEIYLDELYYAGFIDSKAFECD